MIASLELDKDIIVQQVAGKYIDEQQDIIDHQYDLLQQDFNWGAATMHSDAGYNQAQTRANQIQGKYDIDQKLYNLHSGVIGGTAACTTGLLDALTNVLIDKAANQDLFDCYLAIENCFGKILAVEAKGLTLVVESLHFANGDINLASKDYTTTVAHYITSNFQPNIELQVKKFMACVDRLVVSRIDIRTNLANPVQFLPANAGAIYERSDFFVSQLTKAQPAGLILRLIGTHKAVQAAIDAGLRLRERTITCSYRWEEDDLSGDFYV